MERLFRATGVRGGDNFCVQCEWSMFLFPSFQPSASGSLLLVKRVHVLLSPSWFTFFPPSVCMRKTWLGDIKREWLVNMICDPSTARKKLDIIDVISWYLSRVQTTISFLFLFYPIFCFFFFLFSSLRANKFNSLMAIESNALMISWCETFDRFKRSLGLVG